MKALKQNRRMVIVDDKGNIVYSPPDFLRRYISDRRAYNELAERMSGGREDIDHIIKFETDARSVNGRRPS